MDSEPKAYAFSDALRASRCDDAVAALEWISAYNSGGLSIDFEEGYIPRAGEFDYMTLGHPTCWANIRELWGQVSGVGSTPTTEERKLAVFASLSKDVQSVLTAQLGSSVGRTNARPTNGGRV